MKKRIVGLLTGLFLGLTLSVSAATLVDSPADLTWIDSGGAASSVSGDVLTITASKNSQVLADLPSVAELAGTNDFILVSFDVTIDGTAFADDGSSLRIGFNDSSEAYSYYVAFEPYGGANQAIFGETDDVNLGRFDISAMESSTHTISFMLAKTDSAAGLELVAAGDLITETGQIFWAEPDVLPVVTSTFDELYLFFSGSQWLNGQTVTVSNFTVEAVFDSGTPPATNGFVNSAADLTWTSAGGAVSAVSGDTLTITAAKNSQVLAALPSSVELATTNDYLMVSFDVDINGTAFADDGSTFRISFNDSSEPYAYFAAFEPYGGANQAIFGETSDSNLGKFDITAMGSSVHAVSFILQKTDTIAGMELEAISDLITAVDFTKTAEPDILPVITTTFDEIYFSFNGSQWLNGQTVTINNFSIETVAGTNAPDPDPDPTPTVPGNLLFNGDMERGEVDWSANGTHIMVTNVVHAGNIALQYVEVDTEAAVQVLTVMADREYTVSGWIKTDSAFTGTAGISLNFRDIDNVNLGNILVEGTRFAAGTDWTRVSQTIQPKTDAVEMKVMLVTGGTGLAWFDDISVITTNWPADPVIDAPANPPIAGTWTPTFEEIFSGNTIDGAKWKLVGATGVGTDGDQCSVSNGALTITLEQTPTVFKGETNEWSAAAFSTYKRFRQQYGYFEARLRYDSINNMFPAFWTMPDRGWYGNTNENYKTYLKFDLSGISGPVTSAELKLRVSSASTGRKCLNIFPVDDNWSEYLITWNNMPLESPLWLTHDYGYTAVAGTVLSYDLTDYISRQHAEDGIASLVACDTFYLATQTTVDSRETSMAANRPQLVINGTTTLNPSADAYVRSGSYADSNYGYDTSLAWKESWAANNRSTYDGGMEMDIFEDYGHWEPYEFHHGIVWDGYVRPENGGDRQFYSIPYANPYYTVEEYHTYGMYWEDGLIEFYVDGEQTGTFETNRVCSIPSYMLLSLQAFSWGPIPTNQYPATMEVDYVKVWSGTKD